jgi:hypothetical protein
MDEKSLISKIAEIATSTWEEDKEPLLISNIPRHLVGTDFRSVLGEEGVKSFVSRTCAEGGYKLVEDPSHKARVGIIPTEETYQFLASTKQPVADQKRKGETVLRFLELLSELSEEEQRSVVIPVNVIGKLLQK